jgi:hypothetical protein
VDDKIFNAVTFFSSGSIAVSQSTAGAYTYSMICPAEADALSPAAHAAEPLVVTFKAASSSGGVTSPGNTSGSASSGSQIPAQASSSGGGGGGGGSMDLLSLLALAAGCGVLARKRALSYPATRFRQHQR